MEYTNSPLVDYTKMSPNYSKGRVHKTYNPEGVIDIITIHHMAGNCSIEGLGEDFARDERDGSSTYGVGTDGRIAMYVEEQNRPWTSSSRANDYRAITIEVANDGGKPDWHVSDAAIASTIRLIVDICERNGKTSIIYDESWRPDKDMPGNNVMMLTRHDWYANTTCPGPYLSDKFEYIVEKVNAELARKNCERAGKELSLVDCKMYNSEDASRRSSVVSGTYYVWSDEIVNGRIKITNKESRVGVLGQVTGWINLSDVEDQLSNDKVEVSGTQATSFLSMTDAQVIDTVGPLFTADQKVHGILASVSLAQFILESGYGKAGELAQKANNCFGMKEILSGNTWEGSTWDGVSVYNIPTSEYENGKWINITANFRKYPNVEASIADHSAYLIGAKKGSDLRYEGLSTEKDYTKAVQIIKDGGYATDPKYVSKLCNIITRWDLTRFDLEVPKEETNNESTNVPVGVGDVVKIKTGVKYYGLSKVVPSWVTDKEWYVSDVKDDYVVIDKSVDGKNAINSPISRDHITVVKKNTNPVIQVPSFSKGDKVKMKASAVKWSTGKLIPAWIKPRTLYVRGDVDKNGFVQVSTLKVGDISGKIEAKHLQKI